MEQPQGQDVESQVNRATGKKTQSNNLKKNLPPILPLTFFD